MCKDYYREDCRKCGLGLERTSAERVRCKGTWEGLRKWLKFQRRVDAVMKLLLVRR